MNEWVLAEQNHKGISSQKWDAAVLPFGATEPHNFHLPYGTDAYESELVADRICQAATKLGAAVVQLPTIPYGVQSNQMEVAGALPINIYPATLFAFLKDIVDSLEKRGIKKLVLFNSHGGNDFLKPFIREMTGRTSVFLCAIDWWKVGKDHYAEIFQKADDHGGEMETSVMLAIAPELVRPLSEAGDGAGKPTRFEAVNQGWVSLSRPWHLLTESTGVGDPRAAPREKGERYIELIVGRLSKFIAELSKADASEANFPF
jgi:creatinine amidohydrolase